jgi:DNA-binding XRE family transcriptional regulator
VFSNREAAMSVHFDRVRGRWIVRACSKHGSPPRGVTIAFRNDLVTLMSYDVYFTAQAEAWMMALDDNDYDAERLVRAQHPARRRPRRRPPGRTQEGAVMADTPKLTSGKDLRRRRPPNRERVDAIKRTLELDIALNELRARRGITQEQAAAELATSRPNVSRIEREDDLRVTTLQRYVSAIGGELEVTVRFPDGERLTILGPQDSRSRGSDGR